MLSALAALVPALGVLEVLLAVVALLVARYYYKTLGFWSQRGIRDEPGMPLVGSSLRFYLQNEYRGYVMQRFYTKARARGDPCVGLYVGSLPVLLVTDPDLVRAVMAKDFSHFMDRGFPFDRKGEPLTANLLNLEGAEWRSLRHKLTPTFTSGRMRAMFPLVAACSTELSAMLRAEASQGRPVEMFELLARFTTDVIGTCAFGIQANAMKDSEAEFRRMGRKAFDFSLQQAFFTIVAPQLFPLAKKLFGVRILDKGVADFFTSVFQENMEFPALDPPLRGRGRGRGRADCAVQRRRNSAPAKSTGPPETMRLYPAASNMGRVVTEDYTLPIAGKGGRPAVLSKGMRVVIPTFALHRDPEFYPEPDRFDPENFTDEAKQARPHYTYMPFGEGPRICIGLRFAMMQMKAGLATILRDFRIAPVEDDEYPPRFEPRTFVTKTVGGNKVYLHALSATTSS